MELKGLRLNDIVTLSSFVLIVALSIPMVAWAAEVSAGSTPLVLFALPLIMIGIVALYVRSSRMIWLHG
jgi:hypothetical protein